jgi:flagellin
MTRINTNVASLLGQRVLNANNTALNTSLERLSTGLRINRGKDDPAGLIASQNLRAEIAGLDQAIKNAERADQVVNIAEGGLGEISALLNEVQALVTETANTGGLSSEEREANQLQIDSILQTIDRLASATSFQGLRLLNGNFDYQTTSVASEVSSFKVNGAKLGFNETREVDVLVTQSAQRAGFALLFGGNNLNLGGAGATDGSGEQFVIEISGSLGSRELSFASGTQLSAVVAAVNSFTDVTGVQATLSGTDDIRLESTEFGSDEFVSVTIVDDGNITGATGIQTYDGTGIATPDAATNVAFTDADLINGTIDRGQDVGVTINGILATSRGTTARINTDFLDVEIDLAYDTGSTNANAARLGALDAFTIEGGGADFQLAGRVDIGGKVSIGVQNVAARALGEIDGETNTGASTKYFLADLANGQDLNLQDGDLTQAQQVIEKAIREVSSLRGRLGAFQANTIGATIRNLGVTVENTTAAESVIRDTDFATETAELTRGQILVNSATQILAISNQQPQSALQLLG